MARNARRRAARAERALTRNRVDGWGRLLDGGLAGTGLAVVFAFGPASRSAIARLAGTLPPGDLLVPLEPIAAKLWRCLIRTSSWPDRWRALPTDRSLREGLDQLARGELRLRSGAAAGMAFLLVIAALALALF